ncbi:MAG: hypothetical protein RLZ12_59 [Bacillota bacterium]|jgi:glycerol-3-phosphate acyltransferase PlsY
MFVLLIIVGAYLLGALNGGYILTKLVMGKDVRCYGSGNAGATNTVRVAGKAVGIIAGAFDLVKGILALMVANGGSGGSPGLLCFTGIAVISGHNWPIYFNFKGGKGVATSIGVALYLFPYATLLAVICGLLSFVCFRRMFIASLTCLSTLVLFIVLSNSLTLWYLLLLAFMVGASFWQHRTNIRELKLS